MQTTDAGSAAEALVKKLKTCLMTVRVLVFAMVIGVLALVIFVTAASLAGLRAADPFSFMLGVIITGGFAVLCCLGVFVTLILSNIFLKRLKKLDAAESNKETAESNKKTDESNKDADESNKDGLNGPEEGQTGEADGESGV